MTEQVEETVEQVAEATDTVPAAFNDDEILKMVSDGPAKAEDTVEGGEEETVEGEEDTIEGGDEPLAAEEEKPKQSKGRKTASEHIRELKEEKAALKAEAEESKRRIATEEEKSSKLLDFIRKSAGLDADTTEGAEEEIVDEVLAKKVDERFAKLEAEVNGTKLQSAIEMADDAGRKSFTDYDAATEHLVAAEAARLIQRDGAMGKKMSNETAIIKAAEAIWGDITELHKAGVAPQKIAAYSYNQAITKGFTPKAAKAAKDTSKPRVDMKAVERAREEAGAPAIEREEVRIKPGNRWEDDVAARFKAKHGNGKDDYLEKMLRSN